MKYIESQCLGSLTEIILNYRLNPESTAEEFALLTIYVYARLSDLHSRRWQSTLTGPLSPPCSTWSWRRSRRAGARRSNRQTTPTPTFLWCEGVCLDRAGRGVGGQSKILTGGPKSPPAVSPHTRRHPVPGETHSYQHTAHQTHPLDLTPEAQMSFLFTGM